MVESPGPILISLIGFFEDDGWPYEVVTDQTVLRLPFRGEAGNWLCFAQAREEQNQFVFYSVYPVLVPAARRPAMAELLTRVNYGLVMGNFELDYSDGEVRFKTSIDVEGTTLAPPLIQSTVYANVIMMNQYMPAIVALLDEGVEPADALARIEGR